MEKLKAFWLSERRPSDKELERLENFEVIFYEDIDPEAFEIINTDPASAVQFDLKDEAMEEMVQAAEDLEVDYLFNFKGGKSALLAKHLEHTWVRAHTIDG